MRLLRLFALLICMAFSAAGPTRAVEPDEMLPDPALEARARQISAELRCLVCQNQSIDDSNAPLARDLRLLVRERLKTGATDEAVKDFIVQRYGAFVLLKPPFSPETYLLWLAPLLLLGGGLFYLWHARRAAAPIAQEPLTPDEAKKLKRLLEQ